MAKTSKDYFNDGYYEAMNDLIVYIQKLNRDRVLDGEFRKKIEAFAQEKRSKETYLN